MSQTAVANTDLITDKLVCEIGGVPYDCTISSFTVTIPF
jgi:hypothetical protein